MSIEQSTRNVEAVVVACSDEAAARMAYHYVKVWAENACLGLHVLRVDPGLISREARPARSVVVFGVPNNADLFPSLTRSLEHLGYTAKHYLDPIHEDTPHLLLLRDALVRRATAELLS
jgi:hypothetical protein